MRLRTHLGTRNGRLGLALYVAQSRSGPSRLRESVALSASLGQKGEGSRDTRSGGTCSWIALPCWSSAMSEESGLSPMAVNCSVISVRVALWDLVAELVDEASPLLVPTLALAPNNFLLRPTAVLLSRIQTSAHSIRRRRRSARRRR